MGPYEIEGILGTGGMGTVYVARHNQLDRKVALKVIRSLLVDDREVRLRFLREARLMAQLSHPNVVKLYDFGEAEESLYLAMELLDGGVLAVRLRSGPALSAEEVRRFALGLARGVGALHRAGIVHRDLKPENVFVTREGEIKVLDLGLARSNRTTALTQDGVVSGTPYYLAPEIADGAPRDPRYDVFQLGLVLHLMATGKQAFPIPPHRYQLTYETPPPPVIATPGSGSAGFRAVVVRCLQFDPARRFADGTEVEQALLDPRWAGCDRAAGPERASVPITGPVAGRTSGPLVAGAPGGSAAPTVRLVPTYAAPLTDRPGVRAAAAVTLALGIALLALLWP
ncbi:MAG: serine/threonine protein kinase, partial [Candidatus Riflebacteria bacterium]|nr:serine/threonine protein kinase [Candidatus Riflebacteria bacterium]